MNVVTVNQFLAKLIAIEININSVFNIMSVVVTLRILKAVVMIGC